MANPSRHYKRNLKRVWQPALIFALVFAAGGTSGWVTLNSQTAAGHKPPAASTTPAPNKPLPRNKTLAADTEYQLQPASAKVVPQPVDPQTTAAASDPAAAAAGQPVPQSGVSSQRLYSLAQLRHSGVINWNGYKFTYYSQKVLPGGGLRIPGRHVNADGYVCDGEGYIVLANSAPLGTTIPTPFGAPGRVYDRGTVGNHFDVYTS